MKPIVGNPGRLHNLREPVPCWSVFTEGHVTKDGKLVACCFGTGLDDIMIMADLNEVSFEVGWNSVKFQKLREAEEILLILEGEVELALEQERIVLREGDSVYFESSLRHRLLAHGPAGAKVLAVLAKGG